MAISWIHIHWGHFRVKVKVTVIIFNDILHMSFLAGTHVFKAFPAYTTTEL